jgi:hypothetical protein
MIAEASREPSPSSQVRARGAPRDLIWSGVSLPSITAFKSAWSRVRGRSAVALSQTDDRPFPEHRRSDPRGLDAGDAELVFGGFSLATFSVGMKVGQIVEAAWWKGKLREALTSTREPPPSRQMSLVRERRELDDGPLRPSSLLRPPPPQRLQAGPLASQDILRGARGRLGAQKQKNGLREQGSACGLR